MGNYVLAGVDAKAYILTTGTRASWGALNATTGCNEGAAPGQLAELDVVADVTPSVKDGEGEANMRRSKYKLYVPTLTDASIEMSIPWAPTDANFIRIRNAKFTRKTIAAVFLDQDKVNPGAQGLWADWHVFDFSPDQTLDGVQIAKVTFKPAPSAVAPEWVQVPGGGSGSGSGA